MIRTPLRKLVFQIHLWSGILLGLYVVVVCASGSALVFRNDIYDWLETGGKAVAYKASLYHWLSWLGKLHGSLLVENGGMTANAVGGFLLAALCLTGIIVWWPRFGSWRSALTIRKKLGWKRFIFDLHGVLGFWTFAVLLMWGLTGGYFVFPEPFRAAISSLYPDRSTTAPAALNTRRSNPAGIFVRSLRQLRRLGSQAFMGNSGPGACGTVFDRSGDVVEPCARARAAPLPETAARACHFGL